MFWKLSVSLLLFRCCTIIDAQNDDPIVDTEYGTIRGKSIELDDGSVIDTFLGIPFARPPVGDLRFTPPQEPEPWADVLEAFEFGSACIQDPNTTMYTYHHDWDDFSEDCLTLNVYTPRRIGNITRPPLPVMVYIHGGDFQVGSGLQLPGYFLARRDVVVVTVNYRLGLLGFAYTGDDVIPGNIGFLDQIASLRFVRNNIAAFNGNPDQVTIFGESAGAASVGYLIVSPLAADLFHSAILQSGTEFSLWSLHVPESQPENYIVQVAEGFSCPVDDTQAMTECLRQQDALSLISAAYNCTLGYFCSSFRPVIDGTVLPDLPEALRENGQYAQVPEIIGVTQDEMNYYLDERYPGLAEDGWSRARFDAYLRVRSEYLALSWDDPERADDVTQAMRFYYTVWPYFNDPLKIRDMLAAYENDVLFGFTADKQAKLHSEDTNPVYYYVYDYVPQNSDRHPWAGAYHALDLIFTFGFPMIFQDGNEAAREHMQITPAPDAITDFTRTDRLFSEYMITLWTNFAKTFNPSPTPVTDPSGNLVSWREYLPGDLTYLNLTDDSGMQLNYRQKPYAFWTQYMNYLVNGQNAIFLENIMDNNL